MSIFVIVGFNCGLLINLTIGLVFEINLYLKDNCINNYYHLTFYELLENIEKVPFLVLFDCKLFIINIQYFYSIS